MSAKGKMAADGGVTVDTTSGFRKWDESHFEKLAEERKLREAEGDDKDGKGKSATVEYEGPLKAPEDAPKVPGSHRAVLKQRDYKVDVTAALNNRSVVTVKSTGASMGGYHCKVCDCILKDSQAYLSHLNGKRHQKNLGYSMRVEVGGLGVG